MQELLEKLGIDWRLLLAQALNFLVILFVLKKTAYGPLMKLLRERRERVEQGIRDADRAAEQLKDSEKIFSDKVAEAEKRSSTILMDAERAAKEKEELYLSETREKERRILDSAEKKAAHIEESSREKVYEEAVELVKSAVEKIAGQDAERIDNTLIAQAVAEAKKMKI